MAKRFTDTNKWSKEWYRKLGSKMRDVWEYLTDNCDHAGVWDLDLETLQFFTGQKVTVEQMVTAFGGRMIAFDDKVFLKTFIGFQYGELNPAVKAHQGVIKRLRALSLYEPYLEFLKGLPNPFERVQDKNKDKDQDQDKGKGESEGKNQTSLFAPDFEAVYAKYPRKVGKAEARVEFDRQIKTETDVRDLQTAIAAYRAFCEKEKRFGEFIFQFDTFMRAPKGGKVARWRDWLDPNAGSSESFQGSSGVNWDEVHGDESNVGAQS